MKNRIMAILVIVLMCFSMITPVFAISTESGMDKIDGKIYKISYWHPAEYTDPVIVRVSDTSWFLYYMSPDDPFLLNTGGYSSSAKPCIRYAFNSLDKLNTQLFTGEMTHTGVTNFGGNGDLHGITNRFYMSKKEVSELSINDVIGASSWQWETVITKAQYTVNGVSQYRSLETHYADWYYGINGFYPPLAGANTDENVEFMKGEYYAILSQEAMISSGAMNPDGSLNFAANGFVDTVVMKELPLKTTYEIDGVTKGLVYVLITTNKPTGDVIGSSSLSDQNIWQWLISAFSKVGMWLNMSDIERNNYEFIDGYMFYNSKGPINRYYFNTIQDACKFVLYGTAGAEPLYYEIEQTDYGYGYVDVEYNNYDMNMHPKKTIPMEQFPMGRQEIILKQHGAPEPGKEYVYIDLNYYSRVSMIDSEYNLIINNEYMLPKYYTATQKGSEFDARDKSNYKYDSTYEIPRTQTFKLYHQGLEDATGTWDVVYSTYSLFEVKQGQILDGDEHPPVIQIWKDKDGNIATQNTASGEVYIEGNPNPYTDPDGDGIYHDKDGNEWNPNDPDKGWTNEILDWQATIKDYQDSIENLAELIEDFTGFINSSTEQIGEITGLLNAVMLSIPSIFRTLILMSFMALIFGRIIQRK